VMASRHRKLLVRRLRRERRRYLWTNNRHRRGTPQRRGRSRATIARAGAQSPRKQRTPPTMGPPIRWRQSGTAVRQEEASGSTAIRDTSAAGRRGATWREESRRKPKGACVLFAPCLATLYHTSPPRGIG
jgi:hypothetical protein